MTLPERSLRVLFVIEGFADIRFLLGLHDVCQLTVIVPKRHFQESGLKQRLIDSGKQFEVREVSGGRLRYQLASIMEMWRVSPKADVILAQEMLRGALNCCLIGAARRRPVVITMNMPPAEYYRCRRERGQQRWIKAQLGQAVIFVLAKVNGLMAKRCVALGPYLMDVAARYSRNVTMGRYYGVDVDLYRPVDREEQIELRRALDLPIDAFLIFVASRVSHEKDAETALLATALVRKRGLNAVIINLGGGHREFVELAKQLSLEDADEWVLGRPAAHPMKELAKYYQASDILIQSSLEEGAGMAPLEALACGTPVVCTAVGGLARILPGFARLTPRRSPQEMAQQIAWVASHIEEAREQALRGRQMVEREWARDTAFHELKQILTEVALSY